MRYSRGRKEYWLKMQSGSGILDALKCKHAQPPHLSSLVYYEHLWFNARQSAELETDPNTVPEARLTSIEKEEEIILRDGSRTEEGAKELRE